ncbi:MAG: U32 family peptidase [Prevotella sp.]|nr:U32 family peptidase [Prevotella sp.]
MHRIELLAPAKDLACGKAAIDHGADAVYIGASRYGARAMAGNSASDIAELCRYAHQYGAKVYVTVNTLVYDNELEEASSLLQSLKEIAVDAVLIQDMSLVPICQKLGLTIHASTQTDNRSADKVAWLSSVGFSRVVLARELSLEEIRAIHAKLPAAELEVFVHGALCVSYSGQCYASQYCFSRSANRGECAQFCRMKFDLLDSSGQEIVRQRYLLSLKDLCQIDHLESLAEAGAVSFKIEGRLKDIGYVKNIVAAYSRKLDQLVGSHPDKYCRSSWGRTELAFEPNPAKTFNRGYTTYFLNGRRPDIASFDTPKSLGEYVGKVKEVKGNSFNVSSTLSFANGDGLCFFNQEHELEGFRVNRVEGNRIYPYPMPKSLVHGTKIYRNHNASFEKQLASPSAYRKIPVQMRFEMVANGFKLSLFNGDISAVATLDFEHQQAQKSQEDNLVRQLTKLGNTPYVCEKLEVSPEAAMCFVPSSLLSELRRKVLHAVEVRAESPSKVIPVHDLRPVSYVRPYLYNVSNRQALHFYEDHRADHLEAIRSTMASHADGNLGPRPLLMQCRHCIRYSLGHCVKHGGRPSSWHYPLFLRLADGRKFQLEFDCTNCQMNIYGE